MLPIPAASPSTRTSVVTPRKQAMIGGLMFGLSVLSYFDRTSLSIAGPGLMKEFGISAVRMETVYSAFLISYAILMIPGGRMADRFGPRIVLTWMALGSALFTGLLGWPLAPRRGWVLGLVWFPPLLRSIWRSASLQHPFIRLAAE